MQPHKQNMFSEAQSVAMAAGSAPSTNVIDLVANNIGEGNPIDVEVFVATAVTGTGATVALALQDSADNSTFANVLSTKAYAISELGKGKLIKFGLSTPLRRYVRLNYTVAGATTTAGAVTAFLARRD